MHWHRRHASKQVAELSKHLSVAMHAARDSLDLGKCHVGRPIQQTAHNSCYETHGVEFNILYTPPDVCINNKRRVKRGVLVSCPTCTVSATVCSIGRRTRNSEMCLHGVWMWHRVLPCIYDVLLPCWYILSISCTRVRTSCLFVWQWPYRESKQVRKLVNLSNFTNSSLWSTDTHGSVWAKGEAQDAMRSTVRHGEVKETRTSRQMRQNSATKCKFLINLLDRQIFHLHLILSQ